MTASFTDDFWLNLPNYPLDAQGNQIYPNVNPAMPSFQRLGNWNDLGDNGEKLRSIYTKWFYIHPSNWKLWHLAGPGRGKEGIVLSKQLSGVMQSDYEIKYSEGPYVVGAIPQRVNYHKRIINMGVAIQPNGNPERIEPANPFAYRMIEASWWNSWSRTVPGFLGSFTRTHGFRWLSVVLGEAPSTPIEMDPVGLGNNTRETNMIVHAPLPYYSKRALTTAWTSNTADVTKFGHASGILHIPNRGTWELGAWPKFLIQGTGTATVQDGVGGPTVKLPEMFASDGSYMLVDTDPTKQTIVTQNDPIDNQLYNTLRNSQLIDIILGKALGLAASLPAQRRIPGGIGFQNPIPAQTVAALKVTHDNPAATITCIMPQQYEMAWA